HRRRVADEVLPELTWNLRFGGRRTKAHEPLLEALGLQRALERLLDHEDDAMPAPPQDIPDPDAVVRRPERPLGKEDERLARHVRIGCPTGWRARGARRAR